MTISFKNLTKTQVGICLKFKSWGSSQVLHHKATIKSFTNCTRTHKFVPEFLFSEVAGLLMLKETPRQVFS